MATPRARELDRLYQMRQPPPRARGHVPHISISDDNHHVTEAIGHLYGGGGGGGGSNSGNSGGGGGGSHGDPSASHRVSRPLSFLPSPTGDSIPSLQPFEPFDPFTSVSNSPPASSSLRPAMADEAPSPSDTAAQSFPLRDVDYESSPAGLAQELSNLQAIRRMSMGVHNADPDLPSFASASSPPASPAATTTAATVTDEDDDKLFWVPARLHPELAPMEFKTFIEAKVDRIRRRSLDSDTLSADSAMGRQGSAAGLRRKKSMLSRQIDTGAGYRDGADRLERKRSVAQPSSGLPDLHEIANLQEEAAANGRPDSDMPVVRGSNLGGLGTLKRSTRTTYRRGSLRKGGPPLSRRLAAGRPGETDTDESPSTSPVYTTSGTPPPLPVQRVQSEPLRGAFEPTSSNFSRPQRRPSPPTLGNEHSSATQDDTVAGATSSQASEERKSSKPRHFHSRIASNGRTTALLPEYNNAQPVPQIIETPPPPPHDLDHKPPYQLPERNSSRQPLPPVQPPLSGSWTQSPPPSPSSSQQHKHPSSTRPNRHAQAAQASPIKPAQSFDELVSHPSPLPGNTNRVDNLSIIPNLPDDKKSDKKSKDKKDGSDGSRKTSWGWLVGGDKDKERDKKEKEDKDKETAKRAKNKLSKTQERGYDDTRLDLLQNSIQGGHGRESVVLDRENVRLEEERRKESARKSSGEGKKEKEPGLLSTIFGGGKKKGEKDSSHKKTASRGLSPEPPQRILKPDIDYNWTRFSILEERAIYRMAHIKLANPRRELYSQVLLSNFMYSYLAKVQQMHPQISIGNSKQARLASKKEPGAQQSQQPSPQAHQQVSQLQPQQAPLQPQAHQLPLQPQQVQPEEFAQYQRYQQQQQNEQPDSANEWPSYSTQPQENGSHPQQQQQQQQQSQQGTTYNQNPRDSHHSIYSANGSKGYSVANTQNYLGQSVPGGVGGAKGDYHSQDQSLGYEDEESGGSSSRGADDDMW